MDLVVKKNGMNYHLPLEEDNCFFVSNLHEDEYLEACFSEINILLYLYEGKIELSGEGREKYMVSKGFFFVLPKNGSVHGKVVKDAVIIGCMFSSDLHLFSWPLLSRFANSLSESFTYKFSSLKGSPPLHDFYETFLGSTVISVN